MSSALTVGGATSTRGIRRAPGCASTSERRVAPHDRPSLADAACLPGHGVRVAAGSGSARMPRELVGQVGAHRPGQAAAIHHDTRQRRPEHQLGCVGRRHAVPDLGTTDHHAVALGRSVAWGWASSPSQLPPPARSSRSFVSAMDPA